MTSDQKQLITATVPVLKSSGLALTSHFYQRVFAGNPELKNVFNQGNQQNGRQPAALAMAVLAYAENIDDPSVLLSAVTRIGHKHTSLDIRPEHYTIIGNHLIASIGEVLGDAATPALLDAWTAAYTQLARLMMGVEADMYANRANTPGGWTGWRPFMVRAKTTVSAESISFDLYPADGGAVASHEPGQYLSVQQFLPELNLFQPRQYRLLHPPNGQYYQILVSRAPGKAVGPNELFSNRLLDVVQVGDHLELSAPAGSHGAMKPLETD